MLTTPKPKLTTPQTITTTSPNPNNNNPNTTPPKRHRTLSLPKIISKTQTLNDLMIMKKMKNLSLSSTPSTSPQSEPELTVDQTAPDYSSLLTNDLLLNIFSRLPVSLQSSVSLVCKRWCCLCGRLVHSVRVCDWRFIESGRVYVRFPNLTEIDLVQACVRTKRNSGIVYSRKDLSFHLDTRIEGYPFFVDANDVVSLGLVDDGLEKVANWYPDLKRFVVVLGDSENGLLNLARRCVTLQELVLYCCWDTSLQGMVSGFRNLQVVKLVGSVDGLFDSVVSDIGLTLLAHGCRRLVKLELCGCEGSYDGIKAIGQCCQMLEELTLSDHRMEGGWLAALSFCANLKTLRLDSCKSIDFSPGLDEHLGCCNMLEELYIQRCRLRDKSGVKALFLVSKGVRGMVIENCRGLDDGCFGLARVCRRVKLLSLEGCSLLTTAGLESVIVNWNELQSLKVMLCNRIKDSEATPALATLFSVLKELKWRPDSRSLLSASLEGTGVGNKGRRLFKG